MELLAPERVAPKPRRPFRTFTGPSIADAFCESTSWADVLEAYGWRCRDINPDADGARWLHPTHTSSCSATVKHGCLFVYSTNTPFEVTEESNPTATPSFARTPSSSTTGT
jgi:hypothetical protein